MTNPLTYSIITQTNLIKYGTHGSVIFRFPNELRADLLLYSFLFSSIFLSPPSFLCFLTQTFVGLPFELYYVLTLQIFSGIGTRIPCFPLSTIPPSPLSVYLFIPYSGSCTLLHIVTILTID